MSPRSRPLVEDEIDDFVRALIELYQGSSWSDIRPYAVEAWKGLGYPEHQWKYVEGRITSRWNQAHGAGNGLPQDGSTLAKRPCITGSVTSELPRPSGARDSHPDQDHAR